MRFRISPVFFWFYLLAASTATLAARLAKYVLMLVNSENSEYSPVLIPAAPCERCSSFKQEPLRVFPSCPMLCCDWLLTLLTIKISLIMLPGVAGHRTGQGRVDAQAVSLMRREYFR